MLPFLRNILSKWFAEPQETLFFYQIKVLFVQVYKAPTLAADLSHDHAIQVVGWSKGYMG